MRFREISRHVSITLIWFKITCNFELQIISLLLISISEAGIYVVTKSYDIDKMSNYFQNILWIVIPYVL